jgi:hypothetical protein
MGKSQTNRLYYNRYLQVFAICSREQPPSRGFSGDVLDGILGKERARKTFGIFFSEQSTSHMRCGGIRLIVGALSRQYLRRISSYFGHHFPWTLR